MSIILSRRRAFGIIGLVLLGSLLTGCEDPSGPDDDDDSDAAGTAGG